MGSSGNAKHGQTNHRCRILWHFFSRGRRFIGDEESLEAVIRCVLEGQRNNRCDAQVRHTDQNKQFG